jgi:hypothetical protein
VALTRLVAGLATSPSRERHLAREGRLASGVRPTLDLLPNLPGPLRPCNPFALRFPDGVSEGPVVSPLIGKSFNH